MTGYSTPPQPAPPPLGGRPEDRPEPGQDPVWWVRLTVEESWWNRTWFRATLAVSIMAILWVVFELAA
ncbi:MAG: hypothetical protein QNL12_10900 [Acidimicrobiia bacterium]|nr:hypothetical protein [Acidimicrobiia bacterium]MDX2467813.1 hypothetical protein [Acidimicrobiia bacterium]